VDVTQAREPFEVAPDAERVIDKARQQVQRSRWDIAVCSDFPLLSDAGVVVADISASDRVTLVSLPTLGGLRLRARTRDVAVAVAAEPLDSTKFPHPAGSPSARRLAPTT
jgi:hypothetical protein